MCSVKSLPSQKQQRPQQKQQQTVKPMGMLKRSFSCNDDSIYTHSTYHIQEKKVVAEMKAVYSRHSSICPSESSQHQLINYQSLNEAKQVVDIVSSTPYGLPNEDDIAPLVHTAMNNYIDCYFRIIILPILLVIFLAYTFTYLPAPPKAEIYKSLSATFVILMGITLQCCFVTGWAATTLGFGDFLLLLRYAVNPRL
ncbi:hypothetical protein CHUAL_007245 [Chamberlinius hualienensis]